ncbi:hypothetical protein TGAM01_v210393 [Trichoderma gamsii]|uniref:Uncharacterized protein n=1 Tax=Trichoderma gamsii TaxID=398673 RepID=A0A2P4Z8T7_9HYPO|nr:hypothetical protein TGAM01_v210393 [Trichoderma gamsii]PON20703.1 hypothetical protein TGAM01_v210393 [Trichoderma gamsii]
MCKLGHGGDYAVCAQQLGQTAQQQQQQEQEQKQKLGAQAQKEDDSRWLAGEFKTAAAAVTAEMQAMPREKSPGSGM